MSPGGEAAFAPSPALPRLLCGCGREVASVSIRWPQGEAEARCVCGREAARRVGRAERGELWRVAPPAAYWGEVARAEMLAFLAAAESEPWRDAAQRLWPAEVAAYATDPRRAAFQDLLPLPRGAAVLEIGAGLGAISAALARRFRVFALEGVEERARLLALRARQDQLADLHPLLGDWRRVAFAPGQFNGIILNGVLEWAAVGDPARDPRSAQIAFLRRAREWLAPGGWIYLAIENRFGWPELRGARDHSGLPFTSLMPRWLAREVCRRAAPFRSGGNRGYRTYTYSHRGYRRLFAAAGLEIAQTYVCPKGYNLPLGLLPPRADALGWLGERRARPARAAGFGARARGAVKGFLRTRTLRPASLRVFGGDFAFLLRAGPEEEARAPADPSRAPLDLTHRYYLAQGEGATLAPLPAEEGDSLLACFAAPRAARGGGPSASDAARGGAPVWLAKIARGPGGRARLEREARALARLRSLPREGRGWAIPELLDYEANADQACLIQSGLPGRPLVASACAEGLSRRGLARLALAAHWLGAFQRLVPPELARGEEGAPASLAALYREWRRRIGAPATGALRELAALLAWLERESDGAEAAALAPIHGDYWSGNLLIHGRTLLVTDWGGLDVGSPLDDFFVLLLRSPRPEGLSLEAWMRALFFSAGRARRQAEYLLGAWSRGRGIGVGGEEARRVMEHRRFGFNFCLARRVVWELGGDLQERTAAEREGARRDWAPALAWLGARDFPAPLS